MTLEHSQHWFDRARFGLFVHFGIYSVAARHEWVQTREFLSTQEYERYAEAFDPDLFDAKAIARTAKNSGMGYVVLTTKHHDGFALWDTKASDFNAVQACGRDLVREYVDALREEGLRVGFYFSLIDWHHPDFTIDWNHPQRKAENVAELNAGRDMATYRAFLKSQVTELLSNYGTIDYLFFDFTYAESEEGLAGKSSEDWGAEEILDLCRTLQPTMLVNDRLGIPADLVTPEQYQPTQPLTRNGEPVRWEACQTMNGSWGYDRDNRDFKSPLMLMQMLADSVSMDGNMLLNIGPNGRGEITARDERTLGEIGEWLRLHGAAIYGAGHTPFVPPREGVYTAAGNKLFLHVFTWPMGFLHLPGLAGKVRFARLLNDGSELAFSETDPQQQAHNMTPQGQPAGTLTITLPVVKPEVLLPVIELTLG